MLENWNKTVAADSKILGDKGQVPAMPGALTDSLDRGRKSVDAMSAVVAEMQARLITMQKNCGDVVRAGQQFQASIGRETFGLDPKNAEDAKRIQKARALIDAYLAKASKGTSEALMPMARFENALGSFAREVGAA